MVEPAAARAPEAETVAANTEIEDGPLKMNLRKPILFDGDPVKSIEFRQPTGADIEQAGCPVLVDFSEDKPKISFDEKKMTQMLSRLAGVPPSSIRAMHPKDWATAAWNIAGFFVPDLTI